MTKGLLLALAASTLAIAAHAQTFPSRPIRLIVPVAPGGSTDVIARVLAKGIGDQSGQPVVVENRAGASGVIGVSAVVQSAPDGYTILFVTNDPVSVLPTIKKNVPYKVEKDLTPITMIGEAPYVFAVNAKLPANTMKEFLQMAAAKPGEMKFASAGQGTSAHLIMEVLKLRARVDLMQVPYKGVGPSMAALVAGEVDMLPTTPASLRPHIGSGKLKGLATAAAERSPVLPSVPTTAEAGLADFNVSAWWGAFGPAGLPQPVAAKLDEMFRAAISGPDFQKAAATLAITSRPLSGAEFARFVAQDTARWRDTVTRANIPLED